MKTCTKCQQSCPLDYFGLDRSRKDGLQLWCKPCQKRYREAHKEQIRDAGIAWKKANPDKVADNRSRYRAKPEVKSQRALAHQEWRKSNPDKEKAQRQRYYSRHTEEMRARAKEYAAKHPDRVRDSQRKRRNTKGDQIRNYRKQNRHKDRAYYTENADIIRQKRDERRQWVVYCITFGDGTRYIGSSCHADLRFNAHKSLATRDKHIEALNSKDFTDATLAICAEYPSEEAALEGEAQAILAARATDGCLNKTLPALPKSLYWVYVIQSLQGRTGKNGNPLPGFFYVGMTTDPARRLREHNGTYANGKLGLSGGGKYTSQYRPWAARALYGPYFSRSEALRAEYTLKRSKRGQARLEWSPQDSDLCRGLGRQHEWVTDSSGWKPPSPEAWRRL